MKIKLAFAAAALALVTIAPGAFAQETPLKIQPPPLEDLLAEKAKSVVSLKFVLKIQMMVMGQSRDQEKNSEARGVLINDQGLVLTSNAAFEGGLPPALMQMLGGSAEIKATPTNLRVLFGNEVEEYEAQLVARDSNLGVAFVQIMDLKGRETTHVDVENPVPLRLGEELIGVSRMGRGFDCVPSIGRLFVKAWIEKPRKMWAVAGDFDGQGHVVFNRFGVPVGIFAIQSASEGDTGGGGGMDPFAMGDIANNFTTVVLPLSEMTRSLAAAKKRAAEAIEKYREQKEEEADEEEESGEGEEKEDGGKSDDSDK